MSTGGATPHGVGISVEAVATVPGDNPARIAGGVAVVQAR
jgi:hypothetical protein